VIDDSFYFSGVIPVEEEDSEAQIRLPITYPFSATVPEIGRALLKASKRARASKCPG
ncbi:unnamed protein product, partial [Discosporangium mesarthrocarpum]